ncbi:uncharacterized protein LOC128667753 [Microplitis demolitor]|uniref:uncharacterized protein LOC128667753 n=1 Tax=Microplitis demolitor TaxID=69319 RepID=UPI00235B661D|nr:uncharacterized protein LOC128667753 [Microplitis demolitor]
MFIEHNLFKSILVFFILQVSLIIVIADEGQEEWRQFDVNSQDVKQLAKNAFDEYSHGSNDSNEFAIVEIISASYKLTSDSAVHYRIEAKFGETNCPKGHYADICKLLKKGVVKKCDISVYHPYHASSYTSVECSPSKN